LEERLSSYADTYVKDSDFSRKLGELSLELNTLSDLNKSLDERFKAAEGAIQTITTQLIDQTNKSSELRQSTFDQRPDRSSKSETARVGPSQGDDGGVGGGDLIQ